MQRSREKGGGWARRSERFRPLVEGYVVRVEIVFLIGAAEFAVSGEDAHRLEGVIREKCADLDGQPLDENARACLQLADVIREDLERGVHPEPIELGRSHVEGHCEHVIEHEEIGSWRCWLICVMRCKRFRG
jgi:hypothetical protein